MTNAFNSIKTASTETNIGFIVWHSIANVRITETQVQALAAKHGLDDAPKLGHPANAFRRATSAMQERGESKTTRFLMRPVMTSNDTIVREIVVEHVVGTGSDKELTHEGLLKIVYDQTAKTVNMVELNHNQNEKVYTHAYNMACAAIARFEDYRNTLTGKELTRFAMQCLDKQGYINLRPKGGVYFVPISERASVASLMDFYSELASYKISKAEMIFSASPVPNDACQKSQIVQGLNMTIGSDIDQMIARLSECRDDIGSVRMSTLQKKVAEISDLKSKASEYATLLNYENDVLDARLEILNGTMDAVLELYADEQSAK